MTGRRREGLAPNLFPFLAVLICTLGTLILLLAMIAQNSGDAVASSTPPPATPPPDPSIKERVDADAELDRRLGEARWHRDQVVKMRDEQTREIDERRIRQTLLEDHVKRLRAELQRIEAEVVASQQSPSDVNLAQPVIDELKAKIEAEKEKIDKLKNELATTPKMPRIVIVPHKGPNGTDRRPVYIECRADGVYVQPGNVAIDPKYLDTDITGPNPLDAALRTIRSYAMKNYGDVDAPYPLIVVRPDGIETYGTARYAMKGWDDQYGYELVPSDVKLAYPEPDLILNKQVETAIAQAVREQQLIATNGFGRGRGNDNGNSTSNRNGTGNSLIPRRGKGDVELASGDAITNGGKGSSSGNPNEVAGKANSGASIGSDSRPRRTADLPVLSARNMDTAAQDALQNGFNNNRGSRSSQSQSAAKRAAAAAAEQAAADERKLAEEANLLAGRSTANGTSATPQAGSDSGGEKGKGELPSYATLETANDPKSSTGKLAEAKSIANVDRFAPPSDIASKSSQPSASTDPNAPIGGTQSSGSSDSTNFASPTSPPPSKQSSTVKPPPGSQSAPPNVNVDVNGQKPPKSLVKRGGNNWALPPDVASTVGTSMVRMIRVECHEDSLILLPEGGKGATNVYGFSDGDMNRASLELATAIRDRVDRWGAAMPGGRWAPLMDVTILPGGETRYLQLRRLMDGSGVEIQGKGATP